MTCQRCGTKVERGRVLCPNCKEPLRAAVAVTAAQTTALAKDEAVSAGSTLQLPAVKDPRKEEAEVLREGRDEDSSVDPAIPAPDEPPAASSRASVEDVSGDEAADSAKEGAAQAAAASDGQADTATEDAPGGSDDAASPHPPPGDPPSATPAPSGQPRQPGDEILDRFEISKVIGPSAAGVHYHGIELSTSKPFSLWISPAKDAPSALETAETVRSLDHRNISRTLEVVPIEGDILGVTELLDGESLTSHLHRRGGRGFPLSSAVNVALQLAAAMEYAHATTAHGSFGLDAVWVLSTGRLKIIGFGRSLSGVGLPEEHRAADVAALCKLLYELLTGKAWVEDAEPIGRAQPDVPVGIDALLQRGFSGEALTAHEFYHSLASAVGSRPITPPPRVPKRGAPEAPSDKWMLVKGHIDYGPYTMAQLREEVATGRVTPQSVLKSVSTGERKPLEKFPKLVALLEDLERKKAEAQAKLAEERKVKRAKLMRRLRGVGSIAAVLIVAAVVTVFLMDRMQTPEVVYNAPRTELEPPRAARVSIPRVLIRSSKRRRRRRRGRRGRRVASAGQMNAKNGTEAHGVPQLPPETPPPEAELDFGGSGGGMKRMEAKLAVRRSSHRLRPCFDEELRRVPNMRGNFVVSFSVASDGRSRKVRIRGGRSTALLHACIRMKLASIPFPKFKGLPLQVEFPFHIR